MAFRTQRLTNKFPRWTKIRRDPSSFGARMFSVFADYFDFRGVELVKLREELNLLRLHLGRPHVWKIALEEADELPVEITTGGIVTWTYHTTVTGEFSTGTKTLTRVENLEDLLWPVPDEIVLDTSVSVTDFTIWDSTTPTVFNSIANPDRLMVVVEDSDNYFRRTRFRNRAASGFHMLVIEGKDQNGIDFVEYLPVEDDGTFWTKNIISEIANVNTEGFDGDVTIYQNTPITATRMMTDPYHIIMTDSDEGPLKLALNSDVLEYNVQRIKRGANYRTGDPDVVDNDELVWGQALANSAGTALTGIVDIAVNWDTARLYALANTGTVYVYDYGLTDFTPPVDETLLTTETFVETQPLKPWATLSETMTMFTWFLKPRFPVVGVTIKRRDPAGTVEYLQSGLTWAAGVFEHPGNDPENNLPEDTWDNLTFTNTFDQYGEWEFYTTTRTREGDTTTFVKVMVDKLDALAELTTGVSTPTGIYFGETGQLCVTDASTIYKFDEAGHVYLANGSTQQLFFREDYTSVEATL